MRSRRWCGNSSDADIDVLITTYNHPLWIRESLESVINQRFRGKFNIYLYDDNSCKSQFDPIRHEKSDTPRQVLWGLRSQYPGVSYILNRENLGVSRARNLVAQKGSSPWLVFLDGDDKLDRWFLEKVWRRAHIENADVVYPKMAIFTTGELAQHGSVDQGIGFNLSRLVRTNYIPVTALCSRSWFERAGGFDSEMQNGFEDWELWIRLVELGAKFVYDPMAILYYRHHVDARSHIANQMLGEIYAYIKNKHQGLFNRVLKPRVEEIDIEE